MGEALVLTAVGTVILVVIFAFLARMTAQILKDNGRETKVTECIASLNMLMTHVAIYNASSGRSAEQCQVINNMIDAWNRRYSKWRGFEKIPTLSFP